MPRFKRIFPFVSFLLAAFLIGCGGNSQPDASNAEKDKVVRPLPEIEPLINRMVTMDGCRDFTAEMKMTSVDESGNRDQVDFRIQRKYDVDRTLTFISVVSPNEEADKALLAVEKAGESTQAFSYLSGLKKLTRLNSGRQLGFRGAKVTVQELLGMELNQYTHDRGERIEEEGNSLIRVSFREKEDRGLAFPTIVGYFREPDQTPHRFELLDLQGQIVKTVAIDEVKTIDGRQTITEVSIDDLQQKLKLDLVTHEIAYDRGIPDTIFTESHLIKFINNASRLIDK